MVLDLKVRVAADHSQPSSMIKLLGGAEFMKNDVSLWTLAMEGSVQLQMFMEYERISAGKVENLSNSNTTWGAAAEEVLANLTAAGVEQGQVLWIDLHNLKTSRQCVVCAYFSRDILGRGPLHISYQGRVGQSWEEVYRWADKFAAGKEIISISGASTPRTTHPGDGECDKYLWIFHYEGETSPVTQVEHVRSAGGGWDKAASLMLLALQDSGVLRGQLLGIDAHNDDPDADAVFIAHFSRELQGYGRLALTFDRSANEIADWISLHDRVANQSAGRELVSLTGSSNVDRAVMYAFYHVPVDPLEFCIVETAPGTWNAAAEALAARLSELQVERGQIITIDAHNRGFDQPCVLSAHYRPAASAPGGGPLRLAWKLRETNASSWDYVGGWAHAVAEGKDILSCTGASGTLASNALGLSMMIFYHSLADEKATEEPAADSVPMELVTSSWGSWNGAADRIVAELIQAKVERGHIINISACNMNPDANAEFQCHFCRARASGGQRGQVAYRSFNADASFNAMHHQVGVLGSGKDIISITGSSNSENHSVLYVFYWEEDANA